MLHVRAMAQHYMRLELQFEPRDDRPIGLQMHIDDSWLAMFTGNQDTKYSRSTGFLPRSSCCDQQNPYIDCGVKSISGLPSGGDGGSKSTQSPPSEQVLFCAIALPKDTTSVIQGLGAILTIARRSRVAWSAIKERQVA
ncbi:unnamed protein product [Somion occarium]|uniref:Uncharacterized protein n=1 Tax=Somion occarium TaxID=3059160 RepID=A0ABP1D3I2_9APHY